MTAPTQPAVDVSWLRSDPSEMMGHHRPTTFKELVNEGRLAYRRIYQEWLEHNARRAVPDWSATLTQLSYSNLIDPTRERTETDKAIIAEFEKHYKETFYKDAGEVKRSIETQAEQLAESQDLDKADALKQVGTGMAKKAVRDSVKARATKGGVSEGLDSWAQVERYKQEYRDQIGTVLQQYRDVNWGTPQKKAEVQDLIGEALSAERSASATLRTAVLALPRQQDGSVAPIPEDKEAELYDALTNWAAAVNGVATALGQAAEIVADWAEHAVRKMSEEEFNSVYPEVGGILLGSRLAIAAAGAALSFFPLLAPIATGLSLADSVIQLVVKKLTVFIGSKDPDRIKKLIGKSYELPPEYYDTPMGKAYKAKKDLEKRIEDAVKPIRANLSAPVAAIKDKVRDPVLIALLDDLERRIAGTRDKEIENFEEQVAEITGILQQIAELAGADPVMDTISKYLKDAFTGVAPQLVTAVGEAVPIIGVVITVGKAFDDVTDYHADIHKILVNKDGMSDEQVKELETLVGAALRKGPVLRALNFNRVTWLGKDGNRYKVSLAGIVGYFDPETLRFSPEDRSAMKAAVLKAAKHEHGDDGHLMFKDVTYQIDWSTFDIDEADDGTLSAKAKARALTRKGGGDDGRLYAVGLWVDASGAARLLETHVLDGQGHEDHSRRAHLHKQDAEVGLREQLKAQKRKERLEAAGKGLKKRDNARNLKAHVPLSLLTGQTQ